MRAFALAHTGFINKCDVYKYSKYIPHIHELQVDASITSVSNTKRRTKIVKKKPF